MQRIIREEEPPKPSTRLTSSDALPSIAANRSLEPLKLNRLVQGELDWIVMKALEKDRNRRYETASALAVDLQRYFNDEPVEARPATRMYRLRKFVRRNKAGVLAGSAIAAALLLGLALATTGFVQARHQAVRADREAEIAIAQAAKATAISDLLQEALQSANPDKAKGAQYTVRQLLDDIAANLGDELSDQPEAEAAVHATIGNAYRRLGAFDKAGPQLQTALDLRRRLFGSESPDVADSLVDYAWYLGEVNDAQGMVAATQEAVAIHRKLHLPDHQAVKVLEALAHTFFGKPEKYDELEEVAQEIRGIARRQPEKYAEVATVLHWMAATTTDSVKAEQLARESVELHRKLHGEFHPETAWALHILANKLNEQQKFDEAEACYRAALANFRRSYDDTERPIVQQLFSLVGLSKIKGDRAAFDELRATAVKIASLDSVDWQSWHYRGLLHAELGQRELAIAAFSRAIELNDLDAQSRLRRGQIYQELGDFEKSEKDYSEALMLDPGNSAPLIAELSSIGWVYSDHGDYHRAEQLFRQALEISKRQFGNDDLHSARSLGFVAFVLLQQGNLAEAESMFRESLATERKLLQGEQLDVAFSLNGLAQVFAKQNKLADAETMMREALAMRRNLLGNDPAVARSLNNLSNILGQRGKFDEAVAVCREAIELQPQNAQGYNNLAWLLVTATDTKFRDPVQAVELARKGGELAPKDGSIWNTLGIALYRARQWQGAIEAFEKATELRGGGDSSDWFFLAMAHWQLGHKDEAREWYDKAVDWMDKNQPKNEEFRRFRAEAAELLGITQPQPAADKQPVDGQAPNGKHSTPSLPPTKSGASSGGIPRQSGHTVEVRITAGDVRQTICLHDRHDQSIVRPQAALLADTGGGVQQERIDREHLKAQLGDLLTGLPKINQPLHGRRILFESIYDFARPSKLHRRFHGHQPVSDFARHMRRSEADQLVEFNSLDQRGATRADNGVRLKIVDEYIGVHEDSRFHRQVREDHAYSAEDGYSSSLSIAKYSANSAGPCHPIIPAVCSARLGPCWTVTRTFSRSASGKGCSNLSMPFS